MMEPSHEAPLRIFLLGRFEVEVRGVAVPPHRWHRRRPADLLKLVAVAPGGVLHREEAIEALWPKKSLRDGANNLHRALHDLRRVLGEKYLILDKGVLRFGEGVWLDVDAFERALRTRGRDSLVEAVRLYRGDLCPEDPYSPHLTERRQALRQRFVDAALDLGRMLADEEASTEAISVLRRLVEVDPPCEEGHRLLMRLLAESGRKPDAVQQFQACARALRDTLGTEPSAETFALYGSLAEAPAKPPCPPSGWERVARRFFGSAALLPLRGRESEIGGSAPSSIEDRE